MGSTSCEAGIASAQGSTSPVLVSVFLDGGADALQIIRPVAGPQSGLYNDFRPGLRLPGGDGAAFQPDSQWRWHPDAAPLDDIQRGLPSGGNPTVGMAVFPTIGYEDPDQSHFTSRHYWEVGKTDANLRTGWMGRLSTASAPTTTRSRDSPWTAGSRRAWRPRQSPWRRSRGPTTTSSRPGCGTTPRSTRRCSRPSRTSATSTRRDRRAGARPPAA